MPLEIAIAVVAAALLAVTYWMFWAGMAGTVGALRLRRCHHCRRLMPSMHGEIATCVACRHKRAAQVLGHRQLRHYLPKEW